MSREARTSSPPSTTRKADVTIQSTGEAALIKISGLVDERFEGFGQVGKAKTIVIDVSGITRMTSFGVRQWLKGMDALPKSLTDLYLLGCPTFFVDQLNMVLNFGASSKVLTVVAPYTCPACGTESGEIVDVLTERASLAKQPPEKICTRCTSKLEFDETPESYFAFATKYGATTIHPAAAELLAAKQLYAASETSSEKPPRTIKLVHGAVTYFRIIGTIGTLFRARPFVVGAEGEVVIDLAELEKLEPAGLKEWRRLVKTLSGQVSSVTLVDVGESMLKIASDTLTLARNVVVSSLLAPFQCLDCQRIVEESESLAAITWPPVFEDRVCSICGGTTRCTLSADVFRPLQKASTVAPPATAKLVEARDEILSRALTDASVAQAGGTASMSGEDTILGKYKIMRRLSGGGMADVFLAKQVGIGGFEKPVALKRIQSKLLETRQQAIELFLNEAKIAGRLTHPNIVQVLDVGEVGGTLYLAMEYVHGKDLREIIKTLQKTRGKLPLAVACYIVREVAQALDYAYWSTDTAGKRIAVVHRDVSPHNVILGYDGTVKLLDFGVATSAITENAEKLIVGKWMYMAPETTMNTRPDHRSDLFSLGVVLYLLCCGAMPFGGTDPKDIVRKVQAGQYIPVVKLAPEVPAPLERLIDRLLAPSADNRPQRGQEIVGELTEIMRQHGLESSGQQIAELLHQIFPQLAVTVASTEPSVREIVRATSAPEDDTRVVTTPGVPYNASITPSAHTGHRAVDMSQSFQKVPRTTPMPSSSKRPSRPVPVALPIAQQRHPPHPTKSQRFMNILLMLIVLGALGVVAYLFMSSY